MSSSVQSLANPIMKDIGPSTPRQAQRFTGLKLPDNTEVISADGHWEIAKDIFYEGFPPSLKEQAPRVWFDRYMHIGYRGKVEAFPIGERVERCIERGVGPGAWTKEIRLQHLDTEGITKEVVFPQSLLAFVRYPNLDVQENMYRVYNEYITERGKETPGRFYGVGIFNNWWNPAKTEAAMQQIVDLGLKTFMIPVNAGKSLDGKTISYGDPVMDRFWDVVAEAGLPVNFHVGEGIDIEHRGGVGTTVLTTMAPFRKPFGELVFGGVFDRHPNLRIVFSEGGLSWVPPALQDAEMIYDTSGNGDLLEPIEHRPTHYWQNNCYATFQNDLLGLKLLDYIGPDRIMWGSDYPHVEGSFGYGWKSMESVVQATTPEFARKILGGTAREVYKLDQK